MTNILSVSQTAENIPGLSESAIRWHLFNRETNGLSRSGAVLQLGRRILIDQQIFIEWIKGHAGGDS